MATSNDFRNGMIIKMEGKLYSIIEFQHVKPGKGGAFVRSKLKDIEKSGVKTITVDILERYINFLGLNEWFNSWKKNNTDVYERLSKNKR